MRRLAIFGLASALAACSIITGLNADYTRQDPDTEGETGADGMVAVDGNMSSGDANDGAMPSCTGMTFCECYGDASNVAFCWDFESSGASPTAGFSNSEISDGGVLALGADGGAGGSTTYLVATIPAPGADSLNAYVRQELPDQLEGYNEHDLSFAFTIFQSALNATTIGSLGFYDGVKKVNVLTGVGDWSKMSSQHIDISSPPGDNVGSDVVAPPGMWLAARVHLSRSGTGMPYTMEIFATDTKGVEQSVAKGPFDGGVGPTELLFGTYFSSPGDAGASVGIDNILYKRSN